MHLSHDIWLEVLEHCRYDITAEGSDEVRQKRGAIFNIALLDRSLTFVALDMLWMGMKSLQPVLHLVNSFASSAQDAFIRYNHAEDSWELERRVEDDMVHARVQEYLGRIQIFYIDEWNKSEISLWPTLRSCLGGNKLLPKLRELRLDVEHGIFPPAMDLIPLFSPTMTTVAIYHGRFGAGSAHMFLKLLAPYVHRLKKLTYVGSSSPGLFRDFMTSKDLGYLHVGYNNDGFIQRESTVPISQVLKHFASLRTLRIDLRMFPSEVAMSSPPVNHTCLESLRLTGDADDIQHFLLYQLTSSSLLALSLDIRGTPNLSWKLVCGRAASSFPYLRSLTLELASALGCPRLLYEDLLPVLSTPLTELQLNFISHQLTNGDLIAIAEALPHLHKLSISICPDYPPQAFDASVLVPLSQHPQLGSLNLCLNLGDLFILLPNVGVPRSKLKRLSMGRVEGPPPTPAQKAALTENLLSLFPGLKPIGWDRLRTDVTTMIAAFSGRVAVCHLVE